MSLEQAINDNTAALHKLIAVMQSGGVPVGTTAVDTGASAAAASGKATTRGKKETPAAAASGASDLPTTNTGKTLSIKLQPGDPEGTRYFHIAKHNTVAAVRPGDAIPSIEGIAEVDGDEYAALKAKYAAPVPSTGAAGTSTAAPATSAAQTASSSAGAASASASGTATTVDAAVVMAKCKALHGHLGNDALAVILNKHVGKDAKVPQLVAKADAHVAAAADIDKLLALPKGATVDHVNAALAPAAAEADNANLFG